MTRMRRARWESSRWLWLGLVMMAAACQPEPESMAQSSLELQGPAVVYEEGLVDFRVLVPAQLEPVAIELVEEDAARDTLLATAQAEEPSSFIARWFVTSALTGDHVVRARATLRDGSIVFSSRLELSVLIDRSPSSTYEPQRPAAPTGLTAKPGDSQITMSWKPIFRARTYNLYWSSSPGVMPESGNKISSVSSPFVHRGLTAGATYYYVATAVNSAGEGAPSAEVTATIPLPEPEPTEPEPTEPEPTEPEPTEPEPTEPEPTEPEPTEPVEPPMPATSAFEERVLALVNQRRAAGATCGSTRFPPTHPLTMNGDLVTAARDHSQDMADQNYFSHTSLDGRTMSQRIRNAGYTGASPWGENIAAGQSTPESVTDGWMRSEGHCRNIMSGSYRAIGVGYVYRADSIYRHYWTQNFGGT